MKRHGYILVLTLLLVSMSVFLISYVTTRSMSYTSYLKTMVDRQKAAVLASGGLQVALSQLARQPDDAQQKEKQTAAERDRALLTWLLPVLNRWQRFELTQSRDGIKGTLALCITSEEGKIDINELYDFEKKKFVGEGSPSADKKKWLQEFFLRLADYTQGKNLFEAFEKFLKERQYKVRDVTELLTQKEFALFKSQVWYEPPEKVDDEEKKERPVYLTDIFTTWSKKSTIQPWLLSDSLRGVLGLERGTQTNSDEIAELVTKFTPKTAWAESWNTILAPLYKQEWSTLPAGSAGMLSSNFESTFFGVLSAARIGKVTQRLYAIIERKKDATAVAVSIKKVYWL